MNLTYVGNVPVQTQSWIVWVLGLTRATPDALTSDFFLLKYQFFVTLAAALAVVFLALRAQRGSRPDFRSLGDFGSLNAYALGALVTLVFFLTSKKVMGYYYVMLIAFLIAALVPKQRFDLIVAGIAASTWIAWSPYFAGWGDPAHWWIYALLGTANSLFFVWLGWEIWKAEVKSSKAKAQSAGAGLFITLGLFGEALLATLMQPLSRLQIPEMVWREAQELTHPLRLELVPRGMEWNALGALLALGVLSALMLVVWQARWRVPTRAWIAPVVFAPLFFSLYYLTKESTALFELLLKMMGV
jgi:hypothetical protein